MSVPTFYYPGLSRAMDQLIELEGKEAWHALGVKRVGEGDVIRIINGQGLTAQAVVDQISGRHTARLRVKSIIHVPPQQPDIVLASAIAKGDRQSTLLDMATQLGISAYQPLACERSVTGIGKNTCERWQRICLQACKQSGAAWLPELLPVGNPADVVRGAVAEGRRVVFAHPGGSAPGVLPSVDSFTLLVGPEGGFSDIEVSRMKAEGAFAVNLGAQILRIETAAISLLSCLRLS